MKEGSSQLPMFVAEVATEEENDLTWKSADPLRISIPSSTLSWFSDFWSHNTRGFQKLCGRGQGPSVVQEMQKKGREGSSGAAPKVSSHSLARSLDFQPL